MIKHMFLHYNPTHRSFMSNMLKDVSKTAYRMQDFGTLYIKEIDPAFLLMARFAAETTSDVYIECGFVKLSHEDRFKYNRKIGRQLSQINCRLRPVKVLNVRIENKRTVVLCGLENFKFSVEFNHETNKYFVYNLMY